MATNYISSGCTVDYTNATGSAIDSGEVVPLGQQIGIAVVAIAIGGTGVLKIDGVFSVPKVSAAVIGQGESVIYDTSAAEFDDNLATPATGDISGCCVAVEAAGAATTSVKVKLNVGVGTVA